MFLAALDFAAGPSSAAVIVGSVASEDTRAMIRAVAERYLPNVTVLLRPPGAERHEKWLELAPFAEKLVAVDGAATAYVCSDATCGLPATGASGLLKLLGEE